ncbi:hypothetical protein BH11ARM2_BH11ARM2_35430 [soil metagenome]
MKLNSWLVRVLAIGTVAVTAAAPMAQAQSLGSLLKHRQDKKNEWRNIGIGSGVLGVLGLLRHDNTLFFAGTAGALYSSYRYEQDRKSQSKMQRARAAYFSKPYFNRDGYRYTRHSTTKHGKRYFYFTKARLR